MKKAITITIGGSRVRLEKTSRGWSWTAAGEPTHGPFKSRAACHKDARQVLGGVTEVRPSTRKDAQVGKWTLIDLRSGSRFLYGSEETAQRFADQIERSVRRKKDRLD
jgi:hypothetical protein